MESTVFKKMHLEEGAKGIALYAPPEFHAMAAGQELVAFPSRGPYDFVVLFATNLDEYRTRVAEAREALARRGGVRQRAARRCDVCRARSSTLRDANYPKTIMGLL